MHTYLIGEHIETFMCKIVLTRKMAYVFVELLALDRFGSEGLVRYDHVD